MSRPDVWVIVGILAFITSCDKQDSNPMTNSEPNKQENQFQKLLREQFPGEEVAINRGTAIKDSIAKGAAIKFVKGERVVFFGSVAPPGDRPDLFVEKEVLLIVEIDPAKDVRPSAVHWDACVLGFVQDMNPEKKTIRIRAAAGDWKVVSTR